ncbi:hypothetical protein PFISCL1PPCAC_1495, partial [Pristionchus fissidentatus]
LLKEEYGKTVIESPTQINEKAGEEKDLFEGDVLLTTEQLSLIENIHSTNRSRRQALSDAGYSWGTINPVIPYS